MVISMAKIGIINGVDPEVSKYYFDQINKYSEEMELEDKAFNFLNADLERFEPKRLDVIIEALAGWFVSAASSLAEDGCEFVASTSCFLHKIDLYNQFMAQKELREGTNYCTKIPTFIDENDCVAEALEEMGAKKVLFLGPPYIMGDEDLILSFRDLYDIKVMRLNGYEDEIAEVERIIKALRIYPPTAEDKEFLVNFVNQFPCDSEDRPDAIVLSSNELSSILEQEDIYDGVPLIDGTELHIQKIVDLASS